MFTTTVTTADATAQAVVGASNSTADAIGQAVAADLKAQAAAGSAYIKAIAAAKTNRSVLDAAAYDVWTHALDAAMAKQTQDDAKATDAQTQAFDAAEAAQLKQDAQAVDIELKAEDDAAATQATKDVEAALAATLAVDAAQATQAKQDAKASNTRTHALAPAWATLVVAQAKAQSVLNDAMAQANADHSDAYVAAYAAGAASWAGSHAGPYTQQQSAIAAANSVRVKAEDAAYVTFAKASDAADLLWFEDVKPAAVTYNNNIADDSKAFIDTVAPGFKTLLDAAANDAKTAYTTMIPLLKQTADSEVVAIDAWYTTMGGQTQKTLDAISANSLTSVSALAGQLQTFGDKLADDQKAEITSTAASIVSFAGTFGGDLVNWTNAVASDVSAFGAAPNGGNANTPFTNPFQTVELAFADRPKPQYKGITLPDRGPASGSGTWDGNVWKPSQPIKIPNGPTVKQIPFKNGMPDFTQWSKFNSEIVFTGDSVADKAAAIAKWNEANPLKPLPADYVWHHDPHSLQKFKLADGTIVVKGNLQLVPEPLNRIGHVGGNAVARGIRDAQGIAADEYTKLAKAANEGTEALTRVKGGLAKALSTVGKIGKAGLPVVGGILFVFNFEQDVKAHGMAGAVARATPLLGDVMTAYDLGSALADEIVSTALAAEAAEDQVRNGATDFARLAARAAMSNAMNRMLTTVRVPNPSILDQNAIRDAFQAFYDSVLSARLNLINRQLTDAEFDQRVQALEGELERSLRNITGDTGGPQG